MSDRHAHRQCDGNSFPTEVPSSRATPVCGRVDKILARTRNTVPQEVAARIWPNTLHCVGGASTVKDYPPKNARGMEAEKHWPQTGEKRACFIFTKWNVSLCSKKRFDAGHGSIHSSIGGELWPLISLLFFFLNQEWMEGGGGDIVRAREWRGTLWDCRHGRPSTHELTPAVAIHRRPAQDCALL